MRKSLTTTLCAVALLAMAVNAMAAPSGYIDGTVAKSDKNAYDAFAAVKESANNSIVHVQDGIEFVCSNKGGWYLQVTDDLDGSIEVAYKISNDYFVVTFDINGAGKYYVGAGSGKNGVNHAKVAEFVPAPGDNGDDNGDDNGGDNGDDNGGDDGDDDPTVLAEVTFYKQIRDLYEIPGPGVGFVFELFSADYTDPWDPDTWTIGPCVATAVSDEDGYATFQVYEPGYYFIQETEMENWYCYNDLYIIVYEDGTFVSVLGDDTIYNQQLW